jgi:hypothetical protein
MRTKIVIHDNPIEKMTSPGVSTICREAESVLKQGHQQMFNLLQMNSSKCLFSFAVSQESVLSSILILGAWLLRLSPFWTTLNSKMAKCNLIVIVNIQTFETQAVFRKEASFGDGKVLLSRLGSEIHATSAFCTHYGAPLVKGVLTSDGRVVWYVTLFKVVDRH